MTFDKVTLKVMRNELSDILSEYAKNKGISLTVENISFVPDGSSFTAKLQGYAGDKKSIVCDKYEKNFEKYRELYGMNDNIKIGMKVNGYEFVGLDISKPKNSVILLNSKGGFAHTNIEHFNLLTK